MDKKIIVAIDGFSSTGKSTIAKQIAASLGYIYVDTGAMYRAIALYALQNGYVSEALVDKEAIIASLPQISLQFKYNSELKFAEMYLNGINVEKEIRGMEVSGYVSRVAEIPQVRAKLVEQQQKMGEDKGIVMDGRDIGTVVFPGAELKLFMTSSAATRAKRRFEELKGMGQDVSYEEVLKNIEERDYLDTHRSTSPLVRAEGAIEIDNSFLTRQEQFDKVLSLVQKACMAGA